MVIDNIHSIIAAAGVKFNETQIEHLFVLIQEVINLIIKCEPWYLNS